MLVRVHREDWRIRDWSAGHLAQGTGQGQRKALNTSLAHHVNHSPPLQVSEAGKLPEQSPRATEGEAEEEPERTAKREPMMAS